MEHNHTPNNEINPGNAFKIGSKEDVTLIINFF
jgi:hypothetical protein